MAESEEELNSLLMSVKEESGRAGLRLIGPITSQQIEGEEMEAVTELLSLGLESLQTVTAAMESDTHTTDDPTSMSFSHHCFSRTPLLVCLSPFLL